MHILAYFYHWGRNDLWNCPVKERKEWINKICEQLEAEKNALEGKGEDGNSSKYAEGY